MLEAPADWQASLLLDNGGVGVWTVKPFPVFSQYATPEVVGLDDRGRCWVLVSYSGKWTPIPVIHDGAWLGALTHGEVDPRIEGAELYAGGEKGNVYQIVSYPHGVLDYRLLAHLPGREVHTLLAGDLDPRSPGPELLAFTRPGGLYRLTPTGRDGRFETEFLEELPGRVRDAVVLPARDGERPEILTAGRDGRLRRLRFTAEGADWFTVYETGMGLGRLAVAPDPGGDDLVVYSTLDDGQVLRHVRNGTRWATGTIHRGTQGPRGLVAGRFHDDPRIEALALFGYSAEVELLTNRDGVWESETIFRDRDRGHWLATAELDGRNHTREILCSGYGGRIVMLARVPAASRE